MEYHDLVLSGKNASKNILSGDLAFNTLVRNGAKLRISAGGYVETTTVLNSTTVSNAGCAVSTLLSGGTMILSRGGVATGVSVLRNARLSVESGGVATDVMVVANGNVNATIYGGDDVTRIEGSNTRGSFFLSGGTASNFVLNSNGQLTVMYGCTALDTEINSSGTLTVSNGGIATGIVQNSDGRLTTHIRGGDSVTLVSGTNGYGTFLLSGGTASGFLLYENAAQYVSSGGTALGTVVSNSWAHQYVSSGGLASATSVYNKGSMTVYGGGVARDTLVYAGGSMMIKGGYASGVTVSGLLQVTTATAGSDESSTAGVLENIFVLSGGTMDITANAKYSGTVDICGVLKISSGITVSDLIVSSGGSAIVGGAFHVAASTWNTIVTPSGRVTVSSGGEGRGVTVSGGGLLTVSAGGVATDVDQKAGGRIIAFALGGDQTTSIFGSNESGTFLLSNGSASGFVICSGAALTVSTGGVAADVEVRRGGRINVASDATIDGRLLLDLDDSPNAVGLVSDLSRVSPDAEIVLTGISAPGTYVLADSGTPETTVHCMPSGLYEATLRAGERTANAFYGLEHAFDATGRVVTATAVAAAEFSSAAALDSSTEWWGGDRAAKWTAFSASPGAVLNMVEEEFGGDAWLELDGTGLAGTTLYGADAEFSGTINILATSGAALGNLAAGAAAGGSVGGVKFTVEDATVGLAYAGGFGSVTGATETLISGGTFQKDFYAGALANYKNTGVATTVDDISLTVEGGTFSGNLYGASAVKASVADAHTAGDVTLKLADGTAEKIDFCCFAGGYATGNAADAAVYTVGRIELAVTGGSWGEAHGGRGIFGGAFASGVKAAAGDVDITITGGSFGNVYGGGWAQKGGTSIVGNVNISIAGGTIANVFGGGSHSTSGGATVVNDVSITVSGGTISGDIYARGQADGDTAGTTEVIFTGAADFACGVYGYSYVGGEASDATLSFTAYTGTFAGSIGGFDGIVFDDDTSATFGASADVTNSAWNFDAAERDAALADTAFLNWTAADFTGDTIKLNLAEGDATAWSLVGAAADTAYGTFEVQLDGVDIATGLALDKQIADGDYAGWGFTVDGSVLKFKNLA